MKDLTKIKEDVQSAVVGAKNRYIKQLELSKICECGNKKLSQSKTCQTCYNNNRPANDERKTKEFREVFIKFLKDNEQVYTVNELCEIFDMSKGSMYGYMRRLGVSKYIKLRGRAQVKREWHKKYRTVEGNRRARW